MQNKQTAVQWLIENMPEDYRLALPYELVEQAIQMEREQIEEAYYVGKYEWHKHETTEQYYTQTFTSSIRETNNK